MKTLDRSRAALVGVVLLLTMLSPAASRAQFYGSVGQGVTRSSNITGFDTSLPDVILDPFVQAGYGFGSRKPITLDVSAYLAPSIYGSNSGRSSMFSSLSSSLGVYLSNRDAIAREAAGNAKSELDPLRPIDSAARAIARTDSLLSLASSTLGSIVRSLDSFMFAVTTRNFEKPKDSLSEIVLVWKVTLDSLLFTEVVKEVIISDLKQIQRGLNKLSLPEPLERKLTTQMGRAIATLNGIDAQEELFEEALEAPKAEQAVSSRHQPLHLLLPRMSRTRYFSASTIYLPEDALPVDARTFATHLSVPLSYDIRSYRSSYSYLNSTAMSGNGHLTIHPSEGLSSTLSYSLERSSYPNDSVFTSVEQRLRLVGRALILERTALLGELVIGSKRYETPLLDTILISSRPKIYRLEPGASTFDQISYGASILQELDERWILGTSVTLTRSSDLRAYVTSTRYLTETSDDEYTYDLFRLSVFSLSRHWFDLDLSIDLAFQHRKYGEVSTTATSSANVSSANGRKENEYRYGLSLSKYLGFESDLFGFFKSASLELAFSGVQVISSASDYSYHSNSLSLTGALHF